ncbi:NAD(P)/FAD-dependent oxidoreductase [Cupriavidus sp. CuC1]|uniref:NAD(P)/FAD-dependent oxidoreductase n=1 Tax=Cupriavidus sp. CuC1 TaxID=3373131 RepID=UPI0037D61B99
MFLSKHARHVVILCRGASLSAGVSRYLIDQIEETPNVSVRPFTVIDSVAGQDHLSELALRDVNTGSVEAVPAAALFVCIGAQPCTEWLGTVVARDDHGFVLTGRALFKDGKRPASWPLERDPMFLETSVPGIFAAGDVRAGSIKRVAAAVGEGATTIHLVHQYLATK